MKVKFSQWQIKYSDAEFKTLFKSKYISIIRNLLLTTTYSMKSKSIHGAAWMDPASVTIYTDQPKRYDYLVFAANTARTQSMHGLH